MGLERFGSCIVLMFLACFRCDSRKERYPLLLIPAFVFHPSPIPAHYFVVLSNSNASCLFLVFMLQINAFVIAMGCQVSCIAHANI